LQVGLHGKNGHMLAKSQIGLIPGRAAIVRLRPVLDPRR
jgi:hypothetical protein